MTSQTRSYSRGRWIAAWPGGAAIGVANSVAREATYGRRVSEHSGHQISGLTAVGAFAAYVWALQRRWPIPTGTEAVKVGGAWLGLTVAFEFGFGRLVAKQSWDELARSTTSRRDTSGPSCWPGSPPALR